MKDSRAQTLDDSADERRPLVFIDIDGVLNRYRMPVTEASQKGLIVYDQDDWNGRAWTMRLDPADGQRLLSLTDLADLAWATTWTDLADLIGNRIGLPGGLPVAYRKMSEYTKGRGILEVAGDRPFVWFDDEPTTDDWEMFAEHGSAHLAHWYNAYYDGNKVWAVDGQTGEISPWPGVDPATVKTWVRGSIRNDS